MSILSKYVCRRLILYFIFLIAIMMIFFVFIDFMENMERITEHHASFRLIGLYYVNFLPKVFIETSWVSFLIAMMIVLGGLAKNNEFTAMLAGGISIYRIGFPVFILGLILSAGVFCIQEFVLPRSMLRAYELKESDFARGGAESRIFRIAGIGRRNQFYIFDVLDVEKGIITGLQIHKKRGNRIVERIDADKANWDEKKERWFLENCIIRKFDSNGAVTERAELSEMKAPFKESPRTLEIYSSSKGASDFVQMRQKIKNLRRSGYDAHHLKLDYHKKFSLPFANLIVVFFGLPFALECRRGGLIIGFTFALMAALLYYGTFQISLMLGRGGLFSAIVAAWLANILFLAVGIGLALRART